MSKLTPARQLAAFLNKYDPDIAADARGALAHLRKKLPGAFELVYDNYNALAIAFSPSEKASEALLSIAVYPRWVSLFFAQGARLPDPKKLLKGGGTKMRHIVLKSRSDIQSADVAAVIAAAQSLAAKPIDATGKRQLIKAQSAKQRQRRQPAPVAARGRSGALERRR
jgi:ribosomal protein S20